MQSLDDLARAAEAAEVTDPHSLPITDAELGETAAEGAQVVLGGSAPAPTPAVTTPAQPVQLPQMPTATSVTPIEQPAPTFTPVEDEVTPTATDTSTPAASEPLTPFNAQIMQDTAPVPAPQPALMQPGQSMPQPAAVQQSAQQIESPTPPPAAGTMPGQTVTPQSHIIADSYPKPATGADPLSGIAV